MTVDRATDVVAAGAVTSPIWFHWLELASSFAGMLLPILGAAWLVLQIYSKLTSPK